MTESFQQSTMLPSKYCQQTGKMRFRKLSKIELEALSEELIQFLVVQGIDDDLWRDINKKSPEKAEELVALFSDTVLPKSIFKSPIPQFSFRAGIFNFQN